MPRHKSQRLTPRLLPRIKSLKDLNKSFERSYRILDSNRIHLQIQVVLHLKTKEAKIIRPIVALEIIPEDAISLLRGIIIITIITLIMETVPIATEIETGTGILPIEVMTIIAKIIIILASPLTREGLKILIPRIIRTQLILKALINQHNRTLIKMVPKTSGSLETLLAIDQVVSFVVQSVVTHGSTNRIEIASLLRQEETKILPNLLDKMPNVLVIALKLDAQVVSTFLVKIYMLVLTNGIELAICALAQIAGAMNVQVQTIVNLKCNSEKPIWQGNQEPQVLRTSQMLIGLCKGGTGARI